MNTATQEMARHDRHPCLVRFPFFRFAFFVSPREGLVDQKTQWSI